MTTTYSTPAVTDDALLAKFYSTSSTITVSPTIATSAVLVLSANPLRKGLFIYNNSANSVYMAFDTTVSSANHMTLILATYSTFIMTLPIYTGPIAAIRNAGTGNLLITELT